MSSSTLTIGLEAPDFSLPNQDGAEVKLSQFKGSKVVVLYFYPKAMTPGCTKQACALRDGILELQKLDAVVYGVSADKQDALKKFIDKESLNFDLLSDVDHKTCEAYESWAPKKFMGREFLGVLRKTFIIDKGGKIAAIFPKVDVKTHYDDVLKVVKSLS